MPIGKNGQERLGKSAVFILGAGALGSSGAEMLVRAGVGKVTIVDRDYVEWSNLHRQQLYTEQDVAERLPKAICAERRLTAINSDVRICGIVTDVTAENIQSLIAGHDVLLDATDNMETRLLANDAACKMGLPFFMGACVGSYGLTFPFGVQTQQPCLHCLLETLPAQTMTCDTAGIISPAVVTTAARQAAGVLKYLATGEMEPKLESADMWTGERSSIDVSGLKKSDCPSCSEHASYPFLTLGSSIRPAVLCGRDTVQLSWPRNKRLELPLFVQSVRKVVSNLVHNPYLVACEYHGHRIVLFHDGRMLVHGTKSITTAKKIASELVG